MIEYKITFTFKGRKKRIFHVAAKNRRTAIEGTLLYLTTEDEVTKIEIKEE